MIPEVRISALSWSQVTAELDRVAPREGIAVPLVALVPIEFPARGPRHYLVDRSNGRSEPVLLDDGLLISPRMLARAVRQVEELRGVGELARAVRQGEELR